MKFFVFLIVFGAIFAFVSRDGFKAKFMAVACLFSFMAMAASKIGGAVFLDMLGTGVNTFLMVYDVLALLTYKVPQAKPKDEKDGLIEENAEIIGHEMQGEDKMQNENSATGVTDDECEDESGCFS